MEQRAVPGAQAVPRMEEILSSGGRCGLTVTGSSMVPFLRHERDTVVLAPATGELLTPGRILFFQRQDGTYILHRLRRVEKDGSFCICGDAQRWTERIRPEQVIGVVVAVRRQSGRVVDCGGFFWRLCSALWYPTRPLRPLLFRIWAAGRKGAGFFTKKRRESFTNR